MDGNKEVLSAHKNTETQGIIKSSRVTQKKQRRDALPYHLPPLALLRCVWPQRYQVGAPPRAAPRRSFPMVEHLCSHRLARCWRRREARDGGSWRREQRLTSLCRRTPAEDWQLCAGRPKPPHLKTFIIRRIFTREILLRNKVRDSPSIRPLAAPPPCGKPR